MSMELMARAMKVKVGNPVRKLVLLKLADNASDQGECWPSYQYIADQCEVSKRSVITHIDGLIDSGLLRKEVRKGPKGNSSNVYFLTLYGAGDSLGKNNEVVQEVHPPSAGDSLPSAGAASPPSAGAAPRTSHSLESINEPKKESKPKKPSLRTRLIDRYVSLVPEQSIDDALEHRKAKGTANTEKAHTMFFDEVLSCSQELRIAPSAVIDVVIKRDWKGMDTEWVRTHLEKSQPKILAAQPVPIMPPQDSRNAVNDALNNINDTNW